MRRSDQRRDAVFALYQHEVTGRPLEELLEGAKPFTRELAEGVEANRAELDELIARHSKGWALDRIAPLERNIMRVALYEASTATTSRSRSRSTRPSSSPRSTAAPTRRDSSTGSSGRPWRSEARSTDGAALEGVEGLLLDLSGVIYVEDEAVPGAAEALAELRSAGLPIRLVTNTTMRPRRTILERLERLGIEADPAELITPATLAKSRCEQAGYESVSLVVLDELREDLESPRSSRPSRSSRSSSSTTRETDS